MGQYIQPFPLQNCVDKDSNTVLNWIIKAPSGIQAFNIIYDDRYAAIRAKKPLKALIPGQTVGGKNRYGHEVSWNRLQRLFRLLCLLGLDRQR